MFTEVIFQDETGIVPDISIDVLRHVDLGDRVICAYCNVNGLPAKRLTQDIYGKPVNEIPVWNLEGRIVSNWFALILEAKYNEAIHGKTIIVQPDII